ncbi:transglutaminase family protein [Paradesertivirga mongoliensis]|uniref:Transglutaminase family protein n=1 Tax=Paradesertivirga mongoliensis TaxID=2100740 RepID=A0ABW4ZJ84_9SPHI|nr:transglutaminase family protein [Pedobacter mongoliensis]
MRFSVTSQMEYEVFSSSTLILNIHALKTPHQTIYKESLSITPHLEHVELITAQGENRFVRVEVPEPCALKIKYSAEVDNVIEFIDHEYLDDVAVAELDADILPYLYPSRYCQSDKLYRLANNKFGHIQNAYIKVVEITDWIYRNVEYLSGSTNSQTSAYDTVTEQAGVCRDFAHLGIALCRALTIPARYFTGYAFQLDPPDFHACFEAYLGGKWIVFDATRLTPLNGLVKIASGRDAADTAIASIFGSVVCGAISVSTQCMEKKFEPFFYTSDTLKGLNYL